MYVSHWCVTVNRQLQCTLSTKPTLFNFHVHFLFGWEKHERFFNGIQHFHGVYTKEGLSCAKRCWEIPSLRTVLSRICNCSHNFNRLLGFGGRENILISLFSKCRVLQENASFRLPECLNTSELLILQKEYREQDWGKGHRKESYLALVESIVADRVSFWYAESGKRFSSPVSTPTASLCCTIDSVIVNPAACVHVFYSIQQYAGCNALW